MNALIQVLTGIVGMCYTMCMTEVMDVVELKSTQQTGEAENEVFTYPPLTVDEDTFALAMVECGGNISAAYKMTFGEHSSFPIAKGKELLGKPQIALRIKKIADSIQDASLISMGAHLYELADIRDLAKNSGQLKVALSAERARGEVVGLYDNFQHKNNNGATNVQINLVSRFDVDI